MFRYLKDAFLYSPRIPGLGKIPWNLLGVACLAILGFGNPGFWFLGAAIEGTYLFALSTNKRFHRLIEAEESNRLEQEMVRQRQGLIQELAPETRFKLNALNAKRDRIKQLYAASETEPMVIETNIKSLSNLSWLYLKLLVAQHTLSSSESRTTESKLKSQIAAIDTELASEKLSPSLRESRSATQKILARRLENLARREESLKEIASDLERIEAQIDLALENAQIQGQPQAIAENIELVSSQLDESIYGEAGSQIAELEDKYRRLHPPQRVTA